MANHEHREQFTFAADFEARIRILPHAEGGRATPAFNGIRWDFAYADDGPECPLYIIHPDFIDAEGNSLPCDQGLPVGVELTARMRVLNDELCETVHRARIRAGLQFYCCEGSRRVAVGFVTRVTGLFDARPRVTIPNY